MSEKTKKAGIKELSPIDVYKLLPKLTAKNAAKKTAWLSLPK